LFDENKNKIIKSSQKLVITQAFSWFHILSLCDEMKYKIIKVSKRQLLKK